MLLVTLAVSPTEVHRAVTIHLLTVAGCLPLAMAVAFHPVAVVMVVIQVVAAVLPPVVVVALLAAAVAHLAVVAVPQAPLQDLLLTPVSLLPPNLSP